MKHSLSKRRSRSAIRLPFFAIGALSLLLSACSDSGDTTTILDVNPMLTFGLPDDLLDYDFYDPADLRPIVSLSNGAVVSMIGDVQQMRWSGTINVRTDAVYQVTETWVERFQDVDLPLISRTYELVVNKDGSTQQPLATGYGEGFDFDEDGPSNLAERRAGTNPLLDENADQAAPVLNNEPVNEGTESAGRGTPESEPVADNTDTAEDQLPQNEQDSDTTSESETSDASSDADESSDTGTNDESNPLLPTTADVIVPRISPAEAPAIDGLGITLGADNAFTGEWTKAVQSDISGAVLTIDNLMIDDDAETLGNIPFRRWAAMHDGNYLYVLVIVDDDGQRHRDSDAAIYHDDSLELFLDADNSKSSQYGGDDFHRLFPLRQAGAEASKVGVTSGDAPGVNSSPAQITIDFSTGPGNGPDGVRRANFEQDVYELRISLGSAKISTDAPFGFELQINDDDDGQERDSKWGWKHPARTSFDVDNTYKDPSLMGTLMLE